MIHDALIYFVNYSSMIQVSEHVKHLYYNIDSFVYMLDNKIYLNQAKEMVNHIHIDETIASKYVYKFLYDVEWTKVFTNKFMITDNVVYDLVLICCKHGYIDSFKYLVNNKRVNIRDHEMHNVYHATSLFQMGYNYMFNFLINNYTERVGSNNDYYPFLLACRSGSIDIVKYIVEEYLTDLSEVKRCIDINYDYLLKLSKYTEDIDEVIEYLSMQILTHLNIDNYSSS